MSDSSHPLLKIFLGISTLVGISGLVYFLIFAGNTGNLNPSQLWINRKLAREAETYQQLQFELVDPNTAPKSIQELTILGFKAMIDTKKYAPDYVGNELSCTHCHFSGGNTTGGAQGGISLAGVAAKYPAYDNFLERIIDLPTRINNCFLKSMNGKPLPLDDHLMLAFVTYFHWISKNLPIYGDIPWLGLKSLSSKHVGEAKQGKRIYDLYCVLCHHEGDNRGEIYPPPLWGNGAFNDAAGLNHEPKLAAFIYWNMPYIDTTPVLSEEEALDVAAYILTKPRPHFKPPKSFVVK